MGSLKRCPRCKVHKPSEAFSAHKNNPDGLQGRCKDCNRETRLIREYGLDSEQYNQRLEDQGGGCALCGRAPEGIPLDVDHCHTTGKIRGLLCRRCNTFLGVFEANFGTHVKPVLEYLSQFVEDGDGRKKVDQWDL